MALTDLLGPAGACSKLLISNPMGVAVLMELRMRKPLDVKKGQRSSGLTLPSSSSCCRAATVMLADGRQLLSERSAVSFEGPRVLGLLSYGPVPRLVSLRAANTEHSAASG